MYNSSKHTHAQQKKQQKNTNTRIKHTHTNSRVFENKENLIEGALHLASVISSKSPIAVQTTKMALLHARDHAVDDSLHYMVPCLQTHNHLT